MAEKLITVKMGLILEFIPYWEWRRNQTKEALDRRGRNPNNACDTMDDAEIEACDDIIYAAKTFNYDFLPHLREVAQHKTNQRKPTYSRGCDKCDGDAWWLTVYCGVMEKLGILVRQPKTKINE